MNILFYGNCQTSRLANSNTFANMKRNCVLCYATDMTQDQFTKLIKAADIIITQPIKPGYRGKSYLDTEFILKTKRKDSHLILIPSIFCGVYFPDQVYIKTIHGELVTAPCDYQYLNLIKYHINNKDIHSFQDEVVNNPDYIETRELLDHISGTIQLLKDREDIAVSDYPGAIPITISQYIKNNWRDKLLFYSINHPTNYIYNYILSQLVELELVDNYKPFYEGDGIINIQVTDTRSLMYSSVKQQLNFDIKNYQPCLHTNKVIGNVNIIKSYYQVYTEQKIQFETFPNHLDSFTFRNLDIENNC